MKFFGLEVPQVSMGQLPRGQQLLIATALILLGGLLVAHRMIIQPLDQQAATLQQQLNAQQQQAELLRTLNATTQQLTRVQQRLVGRKETTTLLQELTAMAAATHLTLNTIAPQTTQTLGRYPRVPIVIEATGAFSDILQFVHALHASTVVFSIDHLELGSTRTDAGSGSSGGYGAWDATSGNSVENLEASAPLRVRLTVSTLLREVPA